jgi:hypothetical protein
MQHSLAFVICVEPSLEKKSILLIRSIRKFAGRLRRSPIYTFSPRGAPISEWAESQLAKMGAIHSARILNSGRSDDGLANKPFTCAHAERTIDAEILVFLDSDTIIFNEPRRLIFSSDKSLAARPVDMQNIGVRNLKGEGRNKNYWRQLHKICGVRELRYVKTTIGRRRIVEYFNSGMLATRPVHQIFSQWAKNFQAVLRQDLRPTNGHFIEQSVLSATASANPLGTVRLPIAYNYPFTAKNRLLPERRVDTLEKVVSVHYHRTLERGRWMTTLQKLNLWERKGERYQWLLESLVNLQF